MATWGTNQRWVGKGASARQSLGPTNPRQTAGHREAGLANGGQYRGQNKGILKSSKKPFAEDHQCQRDLPPVPC